MAKEELGLSRREFLKKSLGFLGAALLFPLAEESPEASFCENPHFKNSPEISLSKVHLIGALVCFRDQEEGQKALFQNLNFYKDALEQHIFQTIQEGFLEKYFRMEFAYQMLPDVFWSRHDFSWHKANEVVRVLPEGLEHVGYDGYAYPVLMLMYFTNGCRWGYFRPPDYFFLDNAVAGGADLSSKGSLRGFAQLPWRAAFPHLFDIYHEMIPHEKMHAFGSWIFEGRHNTNPKSLMYYKATSYSPILDVNDVEGMCTEFKYKLWQPNVGKQSSP